MPSTDFYLEGSGSGDAGQDIWKPAMQRYLGGIPRTGFKNPPAKIERGKIIDVPRVFGLGMRAATKRFEEAGFNVVQSYIYSDSPEGTFLGYSPSARFASTAVQHDLRPVLERPRPRRGRRRRSAGRGAGRGASGARRRERAEARAEAKKEAAAKKKAAAEAEEEEEGRRGSPAAASGGPEPVEGPLQPNCRRTSAATETPSALPLVCG